MHVGQARSQFPLPHPLLPELETLATSVAGMQGFELCGIQLLTHMAPMTLEVHIRRSNGADVSLDDCAGFSGTLGDALENAQLLSEAYVLEISSPGIGEQLTTDRDFLTFRGFPVKVIHRDGTTAVSYTHLRAHETGGYRVCRLLLERDEDTLQINIRGRIKRLPRDHVLSVRLTSPGS